MKPIQRVCKMLPSVSISLGHKEFKGIACGKIEIEVVHFNSKWF